MSGMGSTTFMAPLSPYPCRGPRPARQPWEGGFQESSRRFLNSSLVPQGENVFFVITNLIVTPNQRQETCAEVCFGTRAGRWWKTPARGGGGEGCAHLQK